LEHSGELLLVMLHCVLDAENQCNNVLFYHYVLLHTINATYI